MLGLNGLITSKLHGRTFKKIELAKADGGNVY